MEEFIIFIKISTMKTLTLKTDRLILNQPHLGDVSSLIEIMRNPVYSQNTTNIPFPYTEANASFWVNLALEGLKEGDKYIFAIRFRDNPCIIGGIGLGIDTANNKAEMGYWLDEQYWNKGYITEAAKALLQFGFETLHLKRIFASHFSHNEASGKIMQKIGMQKEGVLKAHTLKDNEYLDHVFYAIINEKSVTNP